MKRQSVPRGSAFASPAASGTSGTSRALLGVEHLLGRGHAERADELVLEVRDADVEAELLHPGAGEVRAEARPLEAAAEVSLLSRVAEACNPDAEALRAEPLQVPADRLRTAHGHDRDALGQEISAPARGQGFERPLVADPSTSTAVVTPPASRVETSSVAIPE